MKTNRKRLAAILGIAAVLSLVAVMAWGTISAAWFTDQDTFGPNAVNLGTVNPELRGTPITINNGEPCAVAGEVVMTFFNHTNNSTLAVKYRLYSAFVSGNGDLYNKLNVLAQRREGISWVTYYNGLLKDMLIDPSVCAAMASVPSGNSHEWKFTFTPDCSIGNWGQGAGCTFNIVADSTQAINPGWGE